MNNEYKKGTLNSNLDQQSYTEQAKARKVIDVISIPDLVIADATTATLVKKGSLCRILGTALGYVHFGDASVGVPAIATVNTIETTAAWFYTIATGDYIRTSAAMRTEVVYES